MVVIMAEDLKKENFNIMKKFDNFLNENMYMDDTCRVKSHQSMIKELKNILKELPPMRWNIAEKTDNVD